ncbi:hydrolase [Skermanella stibiiresistens SB22]|uniref:Hydrolase n=2 Tax=Skermanella TaxID=204447 RepID=W9H1T5_9PROT|nr:hydrolase [Skermanella stibiiresistens SB22]
MISAVASWHPDAASIDRNDALCLARNIYFEARGESSQGQYAVAAVTMNRVRERRWPDGICGVVYQSKQFSWTITRPASRPTQIQDRVAWARAAEVAVLSLVGLAPDHSRGATHYVAPKRLRRMPVWTAAMDVSHRIDGHVFFSERRGKQGPRRNAPRLTVVADAGGGIGLVVPPTLVAEMRRSVESIGVPGTCGTLRLLPTVNVEAALLDEPDLAGETRRRPVRRFPEPQPWSIAADGMLDRRIRSGARRVRAA